MICCVSSYIAYLVAYLIVGDGPSKFGVSMQTQLAVLQHDYRTLVCLCLVIAWLVYELMFC